MKRAGWFKESWRHGLAARGVKTQNNYLARKTPFQRRVELTELSLSGKTDAEKKAARAELSAMEDRERAEIDARRMGALAKTAQGTLPTTKRERLLGELSLEQTAQQVYVDRSSVGKLVRGIQAGAYSVEGLSYKDVLTDSGYSDTDKLRVKNAINAAAISAASTGQEVPGDAVFQGALTEQTKAQIKAIEKEQKLQRRGAFAGALAEEGKEFAIESEKAIVSAPGELVAGIGAVGKAGITAGEEGLKSAKAPAPGTLYPDVPGGLIPGDVLDTPAGFGPGSNQFFKGDTEAARKESLFFGGNPLTTAGLQENEGVGKLSPLSDISADVFGKKAAGATNEASLLHKEVSSLWNAKDDLVKINKRSFEEGERAFKRGDREALIKAINDLDAEEQKVRDRWMLVEQTRAFMLSPRTRASALREDEGLFGSLGIGASGGRQMAEDSERVNALKRDIKNAHNEIFARKTDLRYKLRRMDATVPSQTDVPREVKVFGAQDGGYLPDMVKPSVALRTAFGPRGE